MRYTSWFLSLFLHAAIAATLIQTARMKPLSVRSVLEVDLVTAVAPLSAPAPALVPTKSPPLASLPVSAPLPQDKTIVLDTPSLPSPDPVASPDLMTPPEPVRPPETVPQSTIEVVEISPVKSPELKKVPKKVIVRKHDTAVHRGHEARFGRALMADYYSYDSSEFSGQFRARDDRTISIIDARNTEYGRFLLYDSKHKTLRRLKKVFKYVYTVGPSLYEDEPVIGSVTFLAKDDRIERFILQTDDDRLAHYPRKIHVREKEVSFAVQDGRLNGNLSLPPQEKRGAGVVFVTGSRCVEPGLIRGVTRSLSSSNIASLSFRPRGCGDADSLSSENELLSDVSEALGYLRQNECIDSSMVGLWGSGEGALVVMKILAGKKRPQVAFAVCVLDDSLALADVPKSEILMQLERPVLWLLTGRHPEEWRPFMARLEAMRDREGKPFTIVVAPLKGSKDVMAAQSNISSWVESVTENHARLAASWIRALKK